MAYSLRDMRKDAGYKSAKLFAEAMDVPAPTYARYEQTPDKIPLKAAWAIADKLGCTIDEVVGRQELEAEVVHGAVQTFYDELNPASKALFDEFMAFIGGREAEAEKRAQAAEDALYAQQALRYEEMFIRASANDKKASDIVLFGTDEEVREEYRKFTWGILEDRRDGEMKSYPHEWIDAYCSAFTPRLDLHVDAKGHVKGEDEENRATASQLLAMAIDKKTAKTIDRYKEVMKKVMEAYDSAHGLT